MSLSSRTGIKLILSSTLLPAGAGARSVHAGDELGTVYQSEQGNKVVVIGRHTITIDNVAHPLEDCSDALLLCASSPIGFDVAFPRKCPAASWFPGRGTLQWSSGFPHSSGGRYVNRAGSSFAYDWGRRNGLNSFVYDPATNFAALPPSYVYEGPTVYYRKSGPVRFACR